jgi:hypothetical protein
MENPRHQSQGPLLLPSSGEEMHQNMFLTAPDVKNIFFKALILVAWK